MVLFVQNNQSGAQRILINLFDRYLVVLISTVSESCLKDIKSSTNFSLSPTGYFQYQELIKLRDLRVLDSAFAFEEVEPGKHAVGPLFTSKVDRLFTSNVD